MNRRNFLQMHGLAVPAAVVAPDLARRYFFAPRGGWFAPDLTAGLPFYRDIDFNGELYRVQESFFKYPPHLVATGKLLTDLGEVVGVIRKPWPTLETDAELRQRMIMVMEAAHGQTWIS